METEEVDVVVIGGGPAGSTVSNLLKHYDAARRVVVLEQSEFPRHHVGESTLPDMNPILARLGVLERIDQAGFVRKTGITYKWSDQRPIFSEVFARGVLTALSYDKTTLVPDHSWQVDRSRYDAILLDQARVRGVDVRFGWRVVDVVREGETVTGVHAVRPDGVRVHLSAGHVVDASGQARVLSRWLDLQRTGHALGDVAIYRYYRGFRWRADLVGSLEASKIFFSATPAGWMWFIPLSETEVSVGLVTRRDLLRDRDVSELFDAELLRVPEIVDMLADAKHTAVPGAPADATTEPARAPTLTVADWSYSHASPCGPGYYLCGDAAAFVDPILSSGILLAHHAGLSVANAIHSEWLGIEPGGDELRAGYARFYGDLYNGFLTMARWWYEQRHLGIDDWLKAARALGVEARGGADTVVDDISAFMTFAAGFLTDFRFVNVGCAFGDAGLAVSIDGVMEQNGLGDGVRRSGIDRSLKLARRFTALTVGSYVATDVSTDRWWRLPEVAFTLPDRVYIYRPAMPSDQRESLGITGTLRVLERTLAAADGSRSVDMVVRKVRDSFPPAERERINQIANVMLADLKAVGVLS